MENGTKKGMMPGGSDRSLVDGRLGEFPFPAEPRPFAMLSDSVLMQTRDPSSRLSKDIYPDLCRPYRCSTTAADQTLRRFLHKAWENRQTCPEAWEKYFPGCRTCPSNGIFIRTMADHLRKQHPDRWRSVY